MRVLGCRGALHSCDTIRISNPLIRAFCSLSHVFSIVYIHVVLFLMSWVVFLCQVACILDHTAPPPVEGASTEPHRSPDAPTARKKVSHLLRWNKTWQQLSVFLIFC